MIFITEALKKKLVVNQHMIRLTYGIRLRYM